MHIYARHGIWHWGALAFAVLIGAAAIAFVMTARSTVVVHPTYGAAVQAVYATGTVEPTVMMPIAPRVGARLLTLDVDEGADVHKGQVLARLEATDLENTLRQAQAQEAFTRQDYDRYAALMHQGIIARQAYDRAKSEWQAAVAATARARALARFMDLTALDDGRIIRRDGEIGQLIPANQPVFWMAGRAAIRISADVDEEDISKVKAGQDVLIRADAFPGRIFQGRVQSITPKGDPVARSYRVRITLQNVTPLMIGMTAETNIIIRETPHALLIPTTALSGGKVWVVQDGKLLARTVTVGTSGRDKVEILGGLSASDLVVETADASLRAGERIHPEFRHIEP